MTSHEKRIQLRFRSKNRKAVGEFYKRCYRLYELMKKKYPGADAGFWERFDLEWKE